MTCLPKKTSDCHKSVCPYCAIGCQIQVTLENQTITRIGADKNARPNYGMLCPKGASLKSPEMWEQSKRLTTPMMRKHRNEPLKAVSWDQAAEYLAKRFGELRQKNGPNALAYYGSGQLDTEASYLFVKLFKGAMGSNNMDTNSRLCMSSAVASYVQSFGSDGPPCCYEDIEHADVFLIIGSNMAINHPVLFKNIHKRRLKNPHARIVVIDPRQTLTARGADIHVPIAPGSDVSFLQLISKRLLAMGRLDANFIKRSTQNFEAYKVHLDSLDEKELLETCDIHPARVDEVVYVLTEKVKLLSLYCQGTNQSVHGVDKNVALLNLHLQLGQIGLPGAGPFSLTGQPNAMGGREVGYLAHQLPGYRLVKNAAHREFIERAWQLPSGSINDKPGLPAVEMFDAIAQKKIDAVWICGTNPAVSMPNTNRIQEALRTASLVVCQDIYRQTETNRFADVLLPAAQWGEKTGTMTNSERLVVRSEKMFDPPKEAKPDWWIAARIGRAMGFKGFDYETAEQVWDEYRQLTANTICNQMGMTNERLKQGPLQWPCPTRRHAGTKRLYTRGKFNTENKRARFTPVSYKPLAEITNYEFPFVLTTGRVANHWHTRTRTGKVPQLNNRDPEPYIQMHPADAKQFGFIEGQMIRVVSRRGEAKILLKLTDTLRRGLLFAPFHWGDEFNDECNINDLTHGHVDLVSKQPELKGCSVRLEPVITNNNDNENSLENIPNLMEVLV